MQSLGEFIVMRQAEYPQAKGEAADDDAAGASDADTSA